MKDYNTYREYMHDKMQKERWKNKRKYYFLVSLFILVCSIVMGFCYLYKTTSTPILNKVSGKIDLTLSHDETLTDDIYNFSFKNNSTVDLNNDFTLTITSDEEQDISSEPLTLKLINTTTSKSYTLTTTKNSKNELVYNVSDPMYKADATTIYQLVIEPKEEESNYINYHFNLGICSKTGNFGYKEQNSMEFDRMGQNEVFTYSINKDNTVSITGLTKWYKKQLQSGEETGFTIPTLYHDLPVKDIKTNAFIDVAANYTVDFEEGVQTIEDHVFSKDLMQNTTLTLPKSLKNLGSENFEGKVWDKIDVNSNITCSSPFRNCTIKNLTINNTDTIPNTIFNNAYSIENMQLDTSITTVGKNAFSNIATMFDTITLPDSIVNIDKEAFMNTNIKTMNLNNTVSIGANAFKNATIVNIDIPDKVSSIGMDAFYGSKLTNLTLNNTPAMALNNNQSVFATAVIDNLVMNNITAIPNYMFNYTSRINHLDVKEHLNGVGTNAFANIDYVGNFTYNNTITKWNDCFVNTGLDSLTFEDGVGDIPASLFSYTKYINQLDLADTTSIGVMTFFGVDMSKCDVVLPETMTNIQDYAFEYSHIKYFKVNKNMHSYKAENRPMWDVTIDLLEFEEGMTTAPNCMFQSATAINNIIFPSSLTSIGEAIFQNANLSNIDEIILPSGVTNIGSSAFTNCTKINKIVLPSNLTSLGFAYGVDSPFIGTKYGTVEFEEGTTKVLKGIFKGGIAINNLILPSSITSIEGNAFCDADLSECIDFNLPSQLTFLGSASFGNVKFNKDAVITLPKTLTTTEVNWDGTSVFNNTTFYHLKIEDGLTKLPNNCLRNTTIADPNFTLKNTTITNIEYCAFYDTNLSACVDFDLPSQLTTVGVRVFGNTQFNKNTIITIPKTLTTINCDWDGASAFSDCTFYHLTIEDGMTSLPSHFLRNATIADPDFTLKNLPIESINTNAFECADLTACANFALPDTIQTLGDYVFNNAKLNNIYIYNKTVSIATNAFNGCTPVIHGYLGSTAEEFSDNKGFNFVPLDDLSALYTYTIDNNKITITGINKDCDIYTKINGKFIIPKKLGNNTVISIADNAFENNTDITSIDIKAPISKIPNNCFKGCTNLTTVKYPSSVVEFGTSAFENTGITSMQIDDTVEKIGDKAIDQKVIINCDKDTAAYEYATNNGNQIVLIDWSKMFSYSEGDTITITGFNTDSDLYNKFKGKLSIPETINNKTVVAINEKAFQGNTKITSVYIPSTITTISGYAFENCSNLKTVTFADGETNTLFLDWHSFDNTAIEGTIIFPARIKDIHCEAFKNTKITDAWFYNPNQEFESGHRVIPETATVHGYDGSTAQSYANNYGHTFEIITN